MEKLKVSNIKCGGCEKTIVSSLEKIGIKNINIDIPSQTISFDGDVSAAREELSRLGYPEADSAESKKLYKKARSYLSCAIGRMKK